MKQTIKKKASQENGRSRACNKCTYALHGLKMDEEIAHYESVLYYQIKQRLDDFSIEYSDVLAKLIECKILTVLQSR